MKSRGMWVIGAFLVLGVAGGVAAPRAWRWWTAPPAGYCPICRRHEHQGSLVKVRAEGEGVTDVCCLSCALAYGRQTARAVTIVSVTDQESGKPLNPDAATFVLGSDVSPCTHDAQELRLEGEALPVQWDRCLPSILAFASRERAERFRGQHGGHLQSLRELTEKAASPSGEQR